VTAGIARACAVALLAEVLLVIGQPSANPLVFAGQITASAFLAGVVAAGLRHLRDRTAGAHAGNAHADGGPW
jgi:hypothetical protein